MARRGAIQAHTGIWSENLQHNTPCLYRWTTTDFINIIKLYYKVPTILLFQNLIITPQKSPSIFFDDTRGLYQTAVNWIQHTFRTSRVLLCNSLDTPDLPNLSAIWISHGPWNRKFSAPSSPSSKLENWVHPPNIGLNLGFVRRKVFLQKGVRPAPVPFPLFLGL